MTCQRQVSILSHTHTHSGPFPGHNLPPSLFPFSVSNVQTISKAGRAKGTHVLPSLDGHCLNFSYFSPSFASTPAPAPPSPPAPCLLRTVTLGIMIFQSSENNF